MHLYWSVFNSCTRCYLVAVYPRANSQGKKVHAAPCNFLRLCQESVNFVVNTPYLTANCVIVYDIAMRGQYPSRIERTILHAEKDIERDSKVTYFPSIFELRCFKSRWKTWNTSFAIAAWWLINLLSHTQHHCICLGS